MDDLGSVIPARHHSQDQTYYMKHQQPDKPRLRPLHLVAVIKKIIILSRRQRINKFTTSVGGSLWLVVAMFLAKSSHTASSTRHLQT